MKTDLRTIQTFIFLTAMASVIACFLPSGSSSGELNTHSGSDAAGAASTPQPVDNCVACHRTDPDGVATLFKSSTHGRSGKTCTSCHGGDRSASDKAGAHSARFIGQPSSNDVLAMCGSCHTHQLAVFKTSRHFPERRGSPRVDCVQCHGAHSVGSPSRNFSFAYYCAGCHGLEYLPHLPAELQKTLSMSDDLNDSIRAIESSGGTLPVEALVAKKEVRRLIADIVHATDAEGGTKKASTIQERIRALTKVIEGKK